MLSKALSWKGFLVTTRLSYAIYLTQFPVFFYNVGRRRHAAFYEFISYSVSTHFTEINCWNYSSINLVFQVNIHEYIWIGIASVALTLLFDCPFQNIKKIIFKSSSSLPSSSLSSASSQNLVLIKNENSLSNNNEDESELSKKHL